MNVYDTVLSLFADISQREPYTWSPFRQGCRIYATDKVSIISVGSGLIEDEYDYLEKPNSEYVMNKPHNRNKILTLEKLANLHNSIPKVNFEECDACDGFGKVKFEFEYDNETYYHSADCPICNGTGKMELLLAKPDYRYGVKFESDTWPIKQKYLSKLIHTMELLDTDTATLVYVDTQIHKFQLVDGIEIMFCAYHPKQEFEDLFVCYEGINSEKEEQL